MISFSASGHTLTQHICLSVWFREPLFQVLSVVDFHYWTRGFFDKFIDQLFIQVESILIIFIKCNSVDYCFFTNLSYRNFIQRIGFQQFYKAFLYNLFRDSYSGICRHALHQSCSFWLFYFEINELSQSVYYLYTMHHIEYL